MSERERANGPTRVGSRQRTTKETAIALSIDLDGHGETAITTGLPFYDHMLDQLGRHGGFDLTIQAEGDLHVDSHHTVEDVAIALGEAFRDALGDKVGIRRFASGLYPLDEALVEVALDLSGRPFVVWEVELPESLPLGNPPFDPQLAEHAVQSFATAAGMTLHVTLRRGRNVHHIIEATFKGLARCLRDAVRIEGDALPSTKGVL
jgi:imidazoleglycerol-phosphate dehydratase